MGEAVANAKDFKGGLTLFIFRTRQLEEGGGLGFLKGFWEGGAVEGLIVEEHFYLQCGGPAT